MHCIATPLEAFSQARLIYRPVGDGCINFCHQADTFPNGRYDFRIMGLIGKAQGPTPSVFEPLFTHLIATDMEIPDFGRDTLEVLGLSLRFWLPLIDVHSPFFERLAVAKLRLTGTEVLWETLFH